MMAMEGGGYPQVEKCDGLGPVCKRGEGNFGEVERRPLAAPSLSFRQRYFVR